VGTQQFDPNQQIALFDDALSSGARTILAVPGDPTTLNNEIAKATAKGVYVGTVMLDAPKSKRDFFIGHDEDAEGREQGQRVLRALHRRGANGVVQTDITTCLPGSTGEPAQSLANTGNLLLAHPDVKVMYPMCAINTLSAGQVVKAKNRKDIIIAGQDWLPQTLDLIEQGWISWSVGELPYENTQKAV